MRSDTQLSEIDAQLAELGEVPSNLDELVAIYGEMDLSEDHLDSVLASLAEGIAPAQSSGLGVIAPPSSNDEDAQIDMLLDKWDGQSSKRAELDNFDELNEIPNDDDIIEIDDDDLELISDD